jgi:hypothetical protein
MSSDVTSVYRQTKPPVFITYQCGAQYTRDFDIPIGMAQLELANSDPRIIMAGPVYPVTDRGGHLCPNGSRWYGEMMAKVYYKTIIKGEKWTPLQPKKFTKGKDFIDIEYHVPEPPIRLDTLTLMKTKNYGFEIKQNGVSRDIANVSIISSGKIRLTVSSLLLDENIEINYAGPSASGHGNICDSDKFISFEKYKDLVAHGETDMERNRFKPKSEPRNLTGEIIYGKPYPLQNFSVAYYYVIPAGKKQLICSIGKY